MNGTNRCEYLHEKWIVSKFQVRFALTPGDGAFEGIKDGCNDGSPEGMSDGVVDGKYSYVGELLSLGLLDGVLETKGDGSKLSLGASDGFNDGEKDGE